MIFLMINSMVYAYDQRRMLEEDNNNMYRWVSLANHQLKMPICLQLFD